MCGPPQGLKNMPSPPYGELSGRHSAAPACLGPQVSHQTESKQQLDVWRVVLLYLLGYFVGGTLSLEPVMKAHRLRQNNLFLTEITGVTWWCLCLSDIPKSLLVKSILSHENRFDLNTFHGSLMFITNGLQMLLI